MQNENLIELHGVKQYFKVNAKGRKAHLKAVDGVDLAIRKGETFGLVGESGCGKSTLGKMLLQLYPLTEGSILLEGEDMGEKLAKDPTGFRCDVQMIFQDPSSCLNPRRKIKDILLEPFVIHKRLSKAEREKKVLELCDMVGLSEVYLERYPHEMSGGQKQRIGIARALALNPKLIVCDEPVSALDVSIQAQVINLLGDLQAQLGLTYLFISHDLSVVKYCCQRIAVMYLGRIVELADAEDLYGNTAHPYTKALISSIPTVEGGMEQERTVLTGDLPSPMAPPSGCRFHPRCPQAMEICKTQEPTMREIHPGHFACCHLCNDA